MTFFTSRTASARRLARAGLKQESALALAFSSGVRKSRSGNNIPFVVVAQIRMDLGISCLCPCRCVMGVHGYGLRGSQVSHARPGAPFALFPLILVGVDGDPLIHFRHAPSYPGTPLR